MTVSRMKIILISQDGCWIVVYVQQNKINKTGNDSDS